MPPHGVRPWPQQNLLATIGVCLVPIMTKDNESFQSCVGLTQCLRSTRWPTQALSFTMGRGQGVLPSVLRWGGSFALGTGPGVKGVLLKMH